MVVDMEPLFAERSGWRRIYPDMPGMGKTRASDSVSCLDDVLDILCEFIDAVAPGQRFTVAGNSYGGYLGRGLVHRRPERIDGILCTVPAVIMDASKRTVPKHQFLKEDAAFKAALKPGDEDLLPFISVQGLDLLDVWRTTFAPAVALADHQFLGRLRPLSFDVDTLPQPFPAPALILAGRYDSAVGYHDAYRILENYPRGTYAVLDRAGHSLPHEQKTVFRALVSEWLDRVEEYARDRGDRESS